MYISASGWIDVLFTTLSSSVGSGYRDAVTFGSPVSDTELEGGELSIGRPSASQRGSPPSRMLELSCPKARNVKRARGEEKIPWVSYLK